MELPRDAKLKPQSTPNAELLPSSSPRQSPSPPPSVVIFLFCPALVSHSTFPLNLTMIYIDMMMIDDHRFVLGNFIPAICQIDWPSANQTSSFRVGLMFIVSFRVETTRNGEPIVEWRCFVDCNDCRFNLKRSIGFRWKSNFNEIYVNSLVRNVLDCSKIEDNSRNSVSDGIRTVSSRRCADKSKWISE